MNSTAAINAYSTVGLESEIIGADPHKLISLLFQGALLEIVRAKNGILRKETAAKGAAISRAIAIIGEGLNASLDKNIGGELAQNLSALYDYMVMRLVAANAKNDIAALDEVTRLLTELKGAWDGIRSNVQSGAPQNLSPNEQRSYARA